MVDIRGYIVLVVIVAIIIFYFLFVNPAPPVKTKTSSVSTIIVQTTSVPSGNQTINETGPNSTHSKNTSAVTRLWVQGAPYPTEIGRERCLALNSEIYCIGGANDVNYTSVSFYAHILANGTSPWRETIPLPIIPSSCITYGEAYIICISGQLLSTHQNINYSYLATLNGTGLTQWNQTNSYPLNGSSNGCASGGIVVFCVGGVNIRGNFPIYSSNVVYAPISSLGIGNWKPTTPLPVNANPQCFDHANTLYCFGSYVNQTQGYTKFAYYAPASASGLQSWKTTTPPPLPAGNFNCNFYDPFIYCIGGYDPNTSGTLVYYSGLSIGGVNGWHQAVSYPVFNGTQAGCTTYNGTTYCIGGGLRDGAYVNNTYFTRAVIP